MIRTLCILLMAACLSVPLNGQAGVISPARVRLVEGDVSFRTPDNEEWQPASINTPLDEGDAIWSANGSRVEIQLPNGSLVRLDSDSELDLLANEDSFIHLHLASGRMYLHGAKTARGQSVQIDADDTTILPDGRTRLRIDMLPNSQEDVSIFKGSAYVEGNGNRTRVRAGEHMALEEGHSEILGLNPPDDWEQWNMERDRVLSKTARADSYLPEELKNYSDELAINGDWVSVPQYGMVWRPSVILSNEWAPYRSGHWLWRGGDYVWVSYDSWGWVPYHYGRWVVVTGRGWCWVPPSRGDVYWGPGFVGWYRAGDRIGWTPLAPGEIYYGRGSYGRHSVNINTTTIRSSTVVYQNRHTPGGVTIIPRNDFLKGKTVIHEVPRRTSPAPAIEIGSPRIKPLREPRIPEVKSTHPRTPPTRMDLRDTRELRQRFPRVNPITSPQLRGPAAPITSTSPVPAHILPSKEKRVVHPVSEPSVRTKSYGTQAPQTVSPQRDEHRQDRLSQPQVKQKRVWKVTTP